MSVTYAFDPGLETLVYEDKGSRVFVTPGYRSSQTGFQPRYVTIPGSWKYGQLYMASWGVTWSGERGVPVFSKLIVDGEVWWLTRGKTMDEGGTFGYDYTGGRRMPNRTVSVRIELGRTVNGEDIVDVLYEGSTVCNGKSGQGAGYPVKILAWDFKPYLYTGEFYGTWFMLLRKAEVGASYFLILRDLDSGELLNVSAKNVGSGVAVPFSYGRLLKPPYGERHLRFSIESPAGEIYDYFDMNVTLSTIPPTTATLQGTVVDAETLSPISAALVECNSLTTRTNELGYYKFTELPLIAYTIYASAASYLKQTKRVNASVAGTYTVNFELVKAPPEEHTLTISTTIGGTTDPAPGSYIYPAGSLARITALPHTDYKFDHWLLDDVMRAENPIDIIMDADHSVKAVFTYVSPPPADATIEGTVTDAETGSPIGGASMTCDGYAAVTDAAGFYQISNIPAQVYTVKAVKDGYQVATIDVDLSAGGSYTLNISLTPSILPPLPPVESLLPAIGSILSGILLIAATLFTPGR